MVVAASPCCILPASVCNNLQAQALSRLQPTASQFHTHNSKQRKHHCINAQSPHAAPTQLAQSALLLQYIAARPRLPGYVDSCRAHWRAAHSRDGACCSRRLHLPQQLGIQLALHVAHGRYGAPRLAGKSRVVEGNCCRQSEACEIAAKVACSTVALRAVTSGGRLPSALLWQHAAQPRQPH